MKKELLILALLCLSTSAWAQRVINLNDPNVGVTPTIESLSVLPQDSVCRVSNIFRSRSFPRTFVINPVLQDTNSVSVGDTIVLQFFDRQSYIADSQ